MNRRGLARGRGRGQTQADVDGWRGLAQAEARAGWRTLTRGRLTRTADAGALAGMAGADGGQGKTGADGRAGWKMHPEKSGGKNFKSNVPCRHFVRFFQDRKRKSAPKENLDALDLKRG